MRIGARLADRGSEVALGRATGSNGSGGNKAGYLCDKVIRKRKRFAGRIRRQAALSSSSLFPNALQELFVACREIFKGPGTVPTPQDVRALCHILDDLRAEDVGLSRDLPFFNPTESKAKSTPKVSFTTIYKCDNFSLCIFFLPSGGIIPLHNHPGMTVFSKLLLGSMHVTSYDWIDPCDLSTPCMIPCPSNVRLAEVKMNGVIAAPCKSSVLYPTMGGNIHEFKARTPCAILDVMGPPYSQQDGRDCSYYRAVPSPYFKLRNADGQLHGNDNIGDDDAEGYGWLEEIEVSEEFLMDWIEYLGPQVMGISC